MSRWVLSAVALMALSSLLSATYGYLQHRNARSLQLQLGIANQQLQLADRVQTSEVAMRAQIHAQKAQAERRVQTLEAMIDELFSNGDGELDPAVRDWMREQGFGGDRAPAR